jgi:PPM family protein phosphatase
MFWKKKNKNNLQKPVIADTMPIPSDLEIVIKTDLGNVRTNNEDAAVFLRVADEQMISKKGCLLIVADGMGGHNAGEVASKMAVEIISKEYFKPGNQADYEKNLKNAFNIANKKIFGLGSSNNTYRGMGTTCTAIVITEQTIYYAHAGDSRAYLYKNNSLVRITEDHTYVQELVNNGDITLQEAETHPQRNILTNAMGTKPELRVDTGKCSVTFDPHDRILVCSDGLYDYLNDDEIAKILQRDLLEDAADYFIAEAKRRGGKDNITVALAERREAAPNLTLKLTRDADLPETN